MTEETKNDVALAMVLGFLLLRDGHAVPLYGLTPDSVKRGANAVVQHPGADPIRHRRTLDAIVDRLGFKGDFGDFKGKGYPKFLAFLKQHGCERPGRLFPSDHGGCIDLCFGKHSATRRQLADRLFESGEPMPKRVFLGYGVDWLAWDTGDGRRVPEAVIPTVAGDPATARARAEALFACRQALSGQWGFLDDNLVAGSMERVIAKVYAPMGVDPAVVAEDMAEVKEAARAFRAVFVEDGPGWVDVLPFNERLVVLRAQDGTWDLVWRAYRSEAPPKAEQVAHWSDLAVVDLPMSLMGENDEARALHFRQDYWEEQEAHAAEQAFYDRGGTVEERRLTSNDQVRADWLRARGWRPGPARVRWSGPVPAGFREVEVDGLRVAMSELVEVGAFKTMLVETGYLERRHESSEPWERANEGQDTGAVGASWSDAQAYCAWFERKLGVAVRLPKKSELRAVHPFYSDWYAGIAERDFWWEHSPPRPLVGGGEGAENEPVPSAVIWSEKRFAEQADGSWEKKWILDFPPRATWVAGATAEYQGLRFFDAWDAYEWCQEQGFVHGRFWEGLIGPTSWGAYKNMKVSFRLVLELEG